MNKVQKEYLEQYLATLTPKERDAIPEAIAEYFCADEVNANECARLINAGIKRASCSLKAGYDAEQELLSKVGRLSVVLNWVQEPVCIIKLKDVSICPFNKVTPEFAALEGEGDLSYQWWRDAHIAFFTKYAVSLNIEFNESSDLVLERFEKVYPR